MHYVDWARGVVAPGGPWRCALPFGEGSRADDKGPERVHWPIHFFCHRDASPYDRPPPALGLAVEQLHVQVEQFDGLRRLRRVRHNDRR